METKTQPQTKIETVEKIVRRLKERYGINANVDIARKYTEALLKVILENRRIVFVAYEVEKAVVEELLTDDEYDAKEFDAYDFINAVRDVLDEDEDDVKIDVLYDDVDEALGTVFIALPRSRYDELSGALDVFTKLLETAIVVNKHNDEYSEGIDYESILNAISDYITYTARYLYTIPRSAPWVAWKLASLLLSDAVQVEIERYGYTEYGLIRINVAGTIYTLSYAIDYCNPGGAIHKCGAMRWSDSWYRE
ncbi:MAG: hypothetical protein QXI07_11630 [Pyrobaculum sp.]